MSTNPHYERAEARLRNGTINEVARASVEATLALAYEQGRTADEARTANLIALWTTPESAMGNVTYGINEGTLGDLLEDILQRLHPEAAKGGVPA